MKGLSPQSIEEMSKCITRLFFDNFGVNKKYIHIYLSIKKNNEVNTSYILQNLISDYKDLTIAVPKSDFNSGTMKHYRYNNFTKLQVNKLGIPEPENGEELNADIFDMVLVPLLCFDKNGYRVGYGKGFYDRFLSACKPDTQKIGLSFFPPVDEIKDKHLHDIKLDACVTPNQVYYFSLIK